MTYNEGWIEVLKGGAAQPLDSARKDLERFGKLFARPGDYWVPRVQEWARARELDIHYIDNCWLKVAVSASLLLEFLEGLDERREQWVAALIARVDLNDSYIIEAEEY
jgi:hypothetical protein